MANPTDIHEQELLEQQAERERAKRLQQSLEDFRELMSHAWGRRIAARLLAMSAIDPGFMPVDAWYGAHCLGRQSIGLQLNALLKECSLDNYLRMVKENA